MRKKHYQKPNAEVVEMKMQKLLSDSQPQYGPSGAPTHASTPEDNQESW